MPRSKTADGFWWEGGETACLLVHGLSSTPQEMELLGKYLHGKGYTVSAPLLPGHNTTPSDLHRTDWSDWYECVRSSYISLKRNYRSVVLVGLSVGALLAAHLAAEHTNDHQKILKGVVLLAPALRYRSRLSWFTPYLWPLKRYHVKDYSRFYPKRQNAYFDIVDEEAVGRRVTYTSVPLRALGSSLRLAKIVEKRASSLTLPLFMAHSSGDHTARMDAAKAFFVRVPIPKAKKHFLALRRSGHVITVDVEKQKLFREINLFLETVCGILAKRDTSNRKKKKKNR